MHTKYLMVSSILIVTTISLASDREAVYTNGSAFEATQSVARSMVDLWFSLATMLEKGSEENKHQAEIWFRQVAETGSDLIAKQKKPVTQDLIEIANKTIKYLNSTALSDYDKSQYKDAEINLLAAIKLERSLLSKKISDFSLDDSNINLAILLTNLGVMLWETDQYRKAGTYYYKALDILENIPKINSIEQISSLSLISIYLNKTGRYKKAEIITEKLMGLTADIVGVEVEAKEALTINQQADVIVGKAFDVIDSGKITPKVKISSGLHLSSIQSIQVKEKKMIADLQLTEQNDFTWGIVPIEKKQIDDAKKSLQYLADHNLLESESAILISKSLAWMYTLLGSYKEAEAILIKNIQYAVKIFDKSPQIAGINSDLARVYTLSDQPEKAKSLYEVALELYQTFYPEKHRQIARALVNLAGAIYDSGDYETAKQHYKRAIEIQNVVLPAYSSERITTLIHIAECYGKLGKPIDALSYYRKAGKLALERQNLMQMPKNQEWYKSTIFYPRTAALNHLDTLLNSNLGTEQLQEVDFSVLQLSVRNQTSDAINWMAKPFAISNEELRNLLQARKRMTEVLTQESEKLRLTNLDEAEQVKLRTEIVYLKKKFTEIDHTIKEKYPKFVDLVAPSPLSIQEVQALLAPDEILLTYVIEKNKSFVLAVRKNKIVMRKLKHNREALENSILILRQSLDPKHMEIKLSQSGFPMPSSLVPFNVKTAYDLYQSLIAPVKDELSDIKHIIMVPDQALISLPVQVLLTETVKPVGKFQFSRYQKLPWLGKQYAISILPMVSSLKGVRLLAKKSAGNIPFMGFGDPILQGKTGSSRSLSIHQFYKGALANVHALRELQRLPNTARELRSIAHYMNSQDNIFIGEDATESRIKTMELSKARIIGFSTHALLADETAFFQGKHDPALVLTPPNRATEHDDGLLTASEIALLNLNADWIVLSACNTAADKNSNAHGLSGLARSFFYAGSRSLLVTHWSVETFSTEKILTRTFDLLSQNYLLKKAEALRSATMEFIEKNRDYAHPAFWGGFFIAGEGGAI